MLILAFVLLIGANPTFHDLSCLLQALRGRLLTFRGSNLYSIYEGFRFIYEVNNSGMLVHPGKAKGDLPKPFYYQYCSSSLACTYCIIQRVKKIESTHASILMDFGAGGACTANEACF